VRRLPRNNPIGTATRGRDCGVLHPRTIAPPIPRAHVIDNFNPVQPRMKEKSEQGDPPYGAQGAAGDR